jgi:hypothetical protein
MKLPLDELLDAVRTHAEEARKRGKGLGVSSCAAPVTQVSLASILESRKEVPTETWGGSSDANVR